jgi:hypothetical protein
MDDAACFMRGLVWAFLASAALYALGAAILIAVTR